MNKFVTLLVVLRVFFVAASSWALGVPGLQSLNSGIALLINVFVGIVETYLIIQLIFHMTLLHKGQSGEKERIVLICVAIFAVPFIPAIGNYLYNLFFQSGGSPASSFWTGQ